MKIDVNFGFVLITILICFLYKINIYFIFFISILLHEMVHMIVGVCLGLKIKKITFNPLGVCLEFIGYRKNKKTIKKIIINLSGPLFNFIFAIIISYLNIEYKLKIDLFYTNLLLGIFNLLPIIPLDGGKILKEILSIKFGYKNANIYSMNISKILLIFISLSYSILIFKIKNVFLFFIIIYLWYLQIIEEKKLRTLIRVYNIIDNV